MKNSVSGYFGLLFVALCISIFGLYSNASAWPATAEPQPVCENVPDFRPALKSDPRYDYDKIAYVIFERSFGGMPFNGQLGIIVDWGSTDRDPERSSLYFKIDAYDNRSLEMVGSSVSSYVINNDGSLTDKNWPGSGYIGLTDLNCIFMTKNVGYMIIDGFVSKNNWVTWGGQDYPVSADTGDQIEEEVECDLLDVVCHIQKGFKGLTDFLAGFWESVTNGFQTVIDSVTDLFGGLIDFFDNLFSTDDDGVFVSAFSDLQNYMRNKLGFLLYPVDFVSSIFGSVLGAFVGGAGDPIKCQGMVGGWQNAVCDGICAPNVFAGHSLCFRIGAMEERFPQLFNTMIIFIRIAVVGAMIELMRRKYLEIVTR